MKRIVQNMKCSDAEQPRGSEQGWFPCPHLNVCPPGSSLQHRAQQSQSTSALSASVGLAREKPLKSDGELKIFVVL